MEFISSFFGRLFQAGKTTERSAIVGMEFYNLQQSTLLLWIEPDCLGIDLNSATEYRIEFDSFEYGFKFEGDSVVIYLQGINTVLRIFERPYSESIGNANPWILTADYSD